LVDDRRWDAFSRKRDAVSRETARLRDTWVQPGDVPVEVANQLFGAPLSRGYSLAELLRRPGTHFGDLVRLSSDAVSRETLRLEFGAPLGNAIAEQVEIGLKYAGYVEKQEQDVERAQRFESTRLPDDLDYAEVAALSFEARQTLGRFRPETLGAASRLSGITPAAVSLLLVHLKKRKRAAQSFVEAAEAD
jgi:tRNA uridine 5-carboxymethylaminomethyl modification enzyme